MAYQKCPICGGSGYHYDTFALSTSALCPTCRGARIIDEVTGLPPYEVKVMTSTTGVTLNFDKDGNLTDHNGEKIVSSYTAN